MNLKKKIAALGVATALAVGSVIISAPAANAAWGTTMNNRTNEWIEVYLMEGYYMGIGPAMGYTQTVDNVYAIKVPAGKCYHIYKAGWNRIGADRYYGGGRLPNWYNFPAGYYYVERC